MAAALQNAKGLLADKPVSRSHHQQRAQPDLVQDQGRHPRKSKRQLLHHCQQDQSPGGRAGSRIHLGCRGGRSRLHRVGARSHDPEKNVHLGGDCPDQRRDKTAHYIQIAAVRSGRERHGNRGCRHRHHPGKRV